MASEQDEEEEQVPGEWRRTRLLTQNWFSGTRASYRMQRESDVCESVCEAGVFVHGGRRCRACHLCVCAQRESVCARARNHQQRARAQYTLSHLHPPCERTVLRRAQIPSAPKAARTHARALSLPLPLSLCLPVSLLPLPLPLPLSGRVCRLREEHR